jgi:flagellum-specific peptidoglycan hydrolase FlgJ
MEGKVISMTRDEFIAQLAPFAVQVRAEGSPMLPSVRLAQNLLETGGKIHPWYNLGGIKVGSGEPNGYWKGKTVNKATWKILDGHRVDITAAFRAYDSIYDFYKDQDLFLKARRYNRVRAAQSSEAQAHALADSGYATDPQYAMKLMQLIDRYGLNQYDMEAEDLVQLRDEVETSKQQVQELQERLYMPTIPEWATEAVKATVDKGIVLSPEGRSLDFYSFLTIIHRLGLL